MRGAARRYKIKQRRQAYKVRVIVRAAVADAVVRVTPQYARRREVGRAAASRRACPPARHAPSGQWRVAAARPAQNGSYVTLAERYVVEVQKR